jgi:hypothetical protein
VSKRCRAKKLGGKSRKEDWGVVQWEGKKIPAPKKILKLRWLILCYDVNFTTLEI